MSDIIDQLRSKHGDAIPSGCSYLWIDDLGSRWRITLASNKTYHSRWGGRRAYATIVDKGALAFRRSEMSAITMWPVRDREQAQRIYERIMARVRKIHEADNAPPNNPLTLDGIIIGIAAFLTSPFNGNPDGEN